MQDLAVGCLRTEGHFHHLLVAIAHEEDDHMVSRHLRILNEFVTDCPLEETIVGDLYLKILAFKSSMQ